MIVICFGTRPEVIKISPLLAELSRRKIPFKTVFTGQHRELFEDVMHLIPKPDYYLNIMSHNQSLNDILCSISQKLPKILKEEKASLLIVQGDTLTVTASALVAFYEKVKVGHVEAGLRTHNLQNPFPEEANRQIVSRIADYNWAPTQEAYDNLKQENVQNIFLTGNTIVDICQSYGFEITYENKVLITLHRRENFGTSLKKMFTEIEQLAIAHPELKFIFPMHPNPNVQEYRHLLKHVEVVSPLKYEELLKLLSEVKFVISDSGGIQEECASFGKKILVCRQTTERPEGVDIGLAKLVGSNILENFSWANDNPEWKGENPYGDGTASKKILDTIKH
ncbi:MAG: UDP-N-acetylglucosamine 2-epimerase (non-hydrolyzing) [Bacteroidales bacterium]|nr:UDP-N-acetylglucosamine 2-epimerase (non-hydrolyzing) [Bacteroidales bacterium]